MWESELRKCSVLSSKPFGRSLDFFDFKNETEGHCENVSACRVVQAYISNYGDKLNIGLLLKNKYHIKLAQKEYGNHVIQCILEKNAWYVFSLWISILSCRLDVHSSFHILRSGLCKKTEHFLSSTSKTLYKDSYIILSKPARNGHFTLKNSQAHILRCTA